ncbi:UNVERIFIED_CONTAM: hypothetical protein Slati_4245700 [Sesamum latifolium]|uniref:Uncharacterized protein n=1 Tax=Sesamum latifolium TaxID=2727402 RepID=A0AAW2TC76_9LAMI
MFCTILAREIPITRRSAASTSVAGNQCPRPPSLRRSADPPTFGGHVFEAAHGAPLLNPFRSFLPPLQPSVTVAGVHPGSSATNSLRPFPHFPSF